MFKEKLPLLEQKINTYKLIENKYMQSDSIKSSMINTYKNTIRENELKIDKQQTKIRNWRRWSLGGFGVTIGTILFLILR